MSRAWRLLHRGAAPSVRGAQSPLLFTIVVLAMCADLFKYWEDLQLGYPVTDILDVYMDVCRYALWADNIYLVATSDSLEYMVAGDAPPCSFEVDIAGGPFPLKRVTK
eukprot:1503419-Pyramimonas_sp.AAC.2